MLSQAQQNELKSELSKFIALSLYPDDEDVLDEYGHDVRYLLQDLQKRANKIFDQFFPEKERKDNKERLKAEAIEKLQGYKDGDYRLTREEIEGYMRDAEVTEFDCNGLILRLP